MEKINEKTGFTEYEENLIYVLCTLYSIDVRSYNRGVFIGLIPNGTRLNFNARPFIKLTSMNNDVYVEMKEDANELIIIHQ